MANAIWNITEMYRQNMTEAMIRITRHGFASVESVAGPAMDGAYPAMADPNRGGTTSKQRSSATWQLIYVVLYGCFSNSSEMWLTVVTNRG